MVQLAWIATASTPDRDCPTRRWSGTVKTPQSLTMTIQPVRMALISRRGEPS